MIEGGPGYPVDGIKESISCELHQRMKNISMKVAVGQALPCPPDARLHGCEIPAGYAKVGVDEIVMGFHDMELDIPGPEDGRTLGEVVGGVILWDKNSIKPPGSAPSTTPPPSHRRSPTPPLPPRSPPPPMTTTTTARVHLDLYRRTWVGRLRRQLLRKLSRSVPTRTLCR
jgi:hypothetical protein